MAEQSVLLGAIQAVRDFGFFDFLLPVVLIFTIVYGILQKTQIFGANKRDIDAIVAFCIALIVLTTSWVVGAIEQILPWVGIIAIVIVSFMMLASMFTGDISQLLDLKKKENKIIVYSGIGLVGVSILIVTLNALGITVALFDYLNATDLTLITLAAVVIGVFFVITKSGESQSSSGGSS